MVQTPQARVSRFTELVGEGERKVCQLFLLNYFRSVATQYEKFMDPRFKGREYSVKTCEKNCCNFNIQFESSFEFCGFNFLLY